jgi:ABC-type nickel/cobalt efflux system permease component RcnA
MWSTYLGAVSIGLIHGLEPGHGWPVAAVYALNRERRLLYGLVTASILSAFHFLSSIAVVLVFLFFRRHLDFLTGGTLKLIAGLLLVGFALHMWLKSGHDHHHEEADKGPASLWQMAAFAFALGFVHEEEFALLSLCLANINCLLLMIAYAAAVTVSLVVLTLAAIGAYEAVHHRFHALERHLPRVSALVLAGLGLFYIFQAI